MEPEQEQVLGEEQGLALALVLGEEQGLELAQGLALALGEEPALELGWELELVRAQGQVEELGLELPRGWGLAEALGEALGEELGQGLVQVPVLGLQLQLAQPSTEEEVDNHRAWHHSNIHPQCLCWCCKLK
jgi:hypothetical protein